MFARVKLIALCSTMVLLTGCASTTIYPNGKNSFSSVTNSSEQGYAEKDAKQKAEKQCLDQGKRLVVVNHHTEYHGADEQTKIVGGVVAALVGGPNFAVSSSDYQVRMTFKCV